MSVLKTPEWLRETLAADKMSFSQLAEQTGIEPLVLARIFAGTIVGTPKQRATSHTRCVSAAFSATGSAEPSIITDV